MNSAEKCYYLIYHTVYFSFRLISDVCAGWCAGNRARALFYISLRDCAFNIPLVSALRENEIFF